jgi:hypothetical protein
MKDPVSGCDRFTAPFAMRVASVQDSATRPGRVVEVSRELWAS